MSLALPPVAGIVAAIGTYQLAVVAGVSGSGAVVAAGAAGVLGFAAWIASPLPNVSGPM